jgi:cbb3-type cytochrome oxidase subunit 3
MSLLQFSLRHLLVAVACIALACTALLNANVWWAGYIWLFTIGLLVVAVLAAIFRRGERQAFWVGFAIAGWLCIVAGSDWFPALAGARQLPQQAMQFLHEKLPDRLRMPYIDEQTGRPVDGAAAPSPRVISYYGSQDPRVTTALTWLARQQQQPTFANNPSYVPLEQFQSIGEAIWTLLMALLGGIVARWLYRSEQRRQVA